MSHSNLDYAYFIACLPDAAAKQRALEEYQKLGLKLRLRPDDVWHITLNDLGSKQPFELSLHIEETVDRACRNIASATAPFKVILDRVLSFKHNSALALAAKQAPNVELKAFRRALRLKLLDHGVFAPSSFNPHLTLLYGDHMVDKLISPPITWQIHEFVLVRSHQGRTHHDHLQRWKLQGTADSKLVQSELF